MNIFLALFPVVKYYVIVLVKYQSKIDGSSSYEPAQLLATFFLGFIEMDDLEKEARVLNLYPHRKMSVCGPKNIDGPIKISREISLSTKLEIILSNVGVSIPSTPEFLFPWFFEYT